MCYRVWKKERIYDFLIGFNGRSLTRKTGICQFFIMKKNKEMRKIISHQYNENLKLNKHCMYCIKLKKKLTKQSGTVRIKDFIKRR